MPIGPTHRPNLPRCEPSLKRQRPNVVDDLADVKSWSLCRFSPVILSQSHGIFRLLHFSPNQEPFPIVSQLKSSSTSRGQTTTNDHNNDQQPNQTKLLPSPQQQQQQQQQHLIMSEERKVALITGITGQDGSYLAELLLSKGYTVSCSARLMSLMLCSAACCRSGSV